MSRLYGEKEKLNSDKIKSFFDGRAKKDVDSILSITMYQDKDNVEKRHLEESKIVLNNIDFTNKKILEIGCGIGRWADVFHDKCNKYLGIDFSKNLIDIANENYNFENCYFQEMSATDIKVDELLIDPPFDIIFISGVLMYLNDDSIKLVINEINNLVSDDKIIYIREPISVMDSRLTLKDFYSEDLEEEYNGIYRTEKELLEFFDGFKDIKDIKKEHLYKELSHHSETGYEFFILK